MATKIKLGIIGMSEGNGHPYSWSAIFNGFNMEHMKNCPFPVIPDYLSKQTFPEDFLIEHGEVINIWTENLSDTIDIAKSANIPNVCNSFEELLKGVDAIIIARDDSERHSEFLIPILKAGLPVFIDKPIALKRETALNYFNLQQFNSQIFTCSSLRFADEVFLNTTEIESMGKIIHVEAEIMNSWEKYGIHLIEPIVKQLENRGKLLSVQTDCYNDIHGVFIKWQNNSAFLKTTGNIKSDFGFTYYCESGKIYKPYRDTFNSFKNCLKNFTETVINKENRISQLETLEIIEILELGEK